MDISKANGYQAWPVCYMGKAYNSKGAVITQIACTAAVRQGFIPVGECNSSISAFASSAGCHGSQIILYAPTTNKDLKALSDTHANSTRGKLYQARPCLSSQGTWGVRQLHQLTAEVPSYTAHYRVLVKADRTAAQKGQTERSFQHQGSVQENCAAEEGQVQCTKEMTLLPEARIMHLPQAAQPMHLDRQQSNVSLVYISCGLLLQSWPTALSCQTNRQAVC